MRGKVAFLVTWVLVWVVLAVWYAGFGDFAPLELSEGRRPMGTTPTTTATTTDKATTPTVPKAISVLGEGVQQVGGGGGSGAVSVLPLPLAPAAPTQAICAEQRAAFATEYTHALQAVNWTAAPRFGLPWRYAEGDAFCGRFLLFNKTGDIWHASGPGLSAASSNTPTTISLFNCADKPGECSDISISARLVGPTIKEAVVRKADVGCAFYVTYEAFEPGAYLLYIKVHHLYANSFNPTLPLSLGLDRSRVRENNKKLFARHNTCAEQRNIMHSPFKVTITGPNLMDPSTPSTPLCKGGGVTEGRWVKFPTNDYCSTPQPYCEGTPWWLADAYGYNAEWLWAPKSCHYKIYSPPKGPDQHCFAKKAAVGIIGDSIAREFVQNCRLFKGMAESANFWCEHWHMIVNGAFFTESYAKSVASVIVDKVISDKPNAIVVNLGLMHMIGMCNDTDWDFFVKTFAEDLSRRTASMAYRKIWLGAPTVQFATRGMTNPRAERWDAIALKHLTPLGFELLSAREVTAPKEEGSWDGLHNAAEKGHKQAKVRNKRVKEYKWNGGVSHMLFNSLVNMLCNG